MSSRRAILYAEAILIGAVVFLGVLSMAKSAYSALVG